ncbi:hypothetical protein GQ55_2G042800 [Panicum hallii var. hallii]|uniref:Uncharacterized protein n=1 Tax=Panicum hallii var. hallii TaxID=1504633 RepID=A0A2T7ELC4_9POAL|nr:hypothetical protein GQ55_2G042800 [Panicum hallii var. hallii]
MVYDHSTRFFGPLDPRSTAAINFSHLRIFFPTQAPIRLIYSSLLPPRLPPQPSAVLHRMNPPSVPRCRLHQVQRAPPPPATTAGADSSAPTPPLPPPPTGGLPPPGSGGVPAVSPTSDPSGPAGHREYRDERSTVERARRTWLR